MKTSAHMIVLGRPAMGWCIYMITNLVTGEKYIGCTSDLSKRVGTHESAARNQRHEHRRVSQAMAQYGIDLFSVRVLKTTQDEDETHLEEQRLIALLKPVYNSDRGGKGRQVKCLDDGLTFKSASACSRHYGINRPALIEHCLGKNGRQHVAHMRFEYVGDSAAGKIESAIKVKRLTPDEVIRIRALKGKKTNRQLREMFFVGRDAIIDIQQNRTWRELN